MITKRQTETVEQPQIFSPRIDSNGEVNLPLEHYKALLRKALGIERSSEGRSLNEVVADKMIEIATSYKINGNYIPFAEEVHMLMQFTELEESMPTV